LGRKSNAVLEFGDIPNDKQGLISIVKSYL
jgi:hypothetical protein